MGLCYCPWHTKHAAIVTDNTIPDKLLFPFLLCSYFPCLFHFHLTPLEEEGHWQKKLARGGMHWSGGGGLRLGAVVVAEAMRTSVPPAPDTLSRCSACQWNNSPWFPHIMKCVAYYSPSKCASCFSTQPVCLLSSPFAIRWLVGIFSVSVGVCHLSKACSVVALLLF